MMVGIILEDGAGIEDRMMYINAMIWYGGYKFKFVLSGIRGGWRTLVV